jgi:hypothetical protein
MTITEHEEQRKMMKIRTGAAVLAAMIAAAPAAQAQSTNDSAILFGASLGATLPVGRLGDTQGTGFNIQGHATIRPSSLPFGFRGDLGYWTTPGKSITPIGGGATQNNRGVNWFTANANVVYNFQGARDATFVPYVLGGVGVYNGSGPVGSAFGVNGGGGVTFRLSGFDAFAEARVHNVFTDGAASRLIPVSFGITFRP